MPLVKNNLNLFDPKNNPILVVPNRCIADKLKKDLMVSFSFLCFGRLKEAAMAY